MENLSKRAREYVQRLDQLRQITSDKTGTSVNEIKINEEAAYPYFESGFTPTQCFREEWQSDGD